MYQNLPRQDIYIENTRYLNHKLGLRGTKT